MRIPPSPILMSPPACRIPGTGQRPRTQPSRWLALAALVVTHAALGQTAAPTPTPAAAPTTAPASTAAPVQVPAIATATPAGDAALVARGADIAYDRELERARTAKTLNTDSALRARSRYIAKPLLDYVSKTYVDAAGWNWSVNVIAGDEPMAYCMPNGKVLISTGLYNRMRLTDHEFAALLAHLIAHALSRQDAEEALAAYRAKRGDARPDPDPNRAAAQMADILADLMRTPHYDAGDEHDTDILAMQLLARSGINPRPAVDAWRKVAQSGGASAPGFLAMHPTSKERIAEIEAQLPELVAIYEAVDANRPPPIPEPRQMGKAKGKGRPPPQTFPRQPPVPGQPAPRVPAPG